MHPEQEAAIRVVEAGVDRLTGALSRECDLCEDDALEIVRGLPDLIPAIQNRDFSTLVTEAVKRAKKVARPSNLKFDAPDPKTYYPYHPKFRPNVTTPSAFNERVSQAAKPYVVAILKRVAKDRGLAEPDAKTIQAVMDNIDWSKAAYEAKRMPPNPSQAALKKFFTKLWKPVGRVLDSAPLEWFWQAVVGTMSLLALYKMFSNSWSVKDKTHKLYRAGVGVANRYQNYADRTADRKVTRRAWK